MDISSFPKPKTHSNLLFDLNGTHSLPQLLAGLLAYIWSLWRLAFAAHLIEFMNTQVGVGHTSGHICEGISGKAKGWGKILLAVGGDVTFSVVLDWIKGKNRKKKKRWANVFFSSLLFPSPSFLPPLPSFLFSSPLLFLTAETTWLPQCLAGYVFNKINPSFFNVFQSSILSQKWEDQWAQFPSCMQVTGS